MITIRIIDPAAPSASGYPSTIHAGRLCFAVPAGHRFNISSLLELSNDFTPGSRIEWVVAVDGRDTLTNKPASRSLEGMISGRRYTCEGFRVSSSEVREFVCVNLGDGATTAERNGTTSSAGLVAVAAFAERRVERTIYRGGGGVRGMTLGGPPMRGGVVTCSAGPTAGAAAGASVTSHVGTTTWERGPALGAVVVEYDTPEGWALRGVSFERPAPLPERNPWPGEIPAPTRYADPQTL